MTRDLKAPMREVCYSLHVSAGRTGARDWSTQAHVSLLDSLLDAIIRFNGDALVMRVGDKPFVVKGTDPVRRSQRGYADRRVELSSRVLTSATVAAVLNRILSADHRAALARSGMTECDVTSPSYPTERFTIVAFRSDDDVSLEVRRQDRPTSAAPLPTGAVAFDDRAGTAASADADDGDDVMTEGELSDMLRASAATTGGRTDLPGRAHSGPAGAAGAKAEPTAAGHVAPPRSPAQVVPLARRFQSGSSAESDPSALWPRAVQLAAAHGAAALYLVANSSPFIRLGGEFLPLEGVPNAGAAALERLIADLRGQAGVLSVAAGAAWTARVPGCGPVRCVAFRDERGPGLVCRLLPAALLAADQVGLPPEILALSSEADGLVLVAGGRGSGRSTFLASLVDVVNRTRSDHVITVESRLAFVHDVQRSFVSQREIPDEGEAFAAAIRSAMQEEPDVLAIDDLHTPEVAELALEAAGRMLVLAAVEAVTTASAVQRILEMVPPERRDRAQAHLGGVLRGAVALMLLRKRAGGRVAAREVLLNAPPIAGMIAEGRTADLPAAIDRGRADGMVPFSEALAVLVRNGTVHPSHAWRNAPDRDAFLAALRRNGVAADVLERLA